MKIHEGRDLDGRLDGGEDVTNDDQPAMKRKRGGDYGRDWVCDFEGCTKDFKSVFPSSKCLLAAHDHGSNRKRLSQHIITSHTSTNVISFVLTKGVPRPTVTSIFSDVISPKRIQRQNRLIAPAIQSKTTREVSRWTSTGLPVDPT